MNERTKTIIQELELAEHPIAELVVSMIMKNPFWTVRYAEAEKFIRSDIAHTFEHAKTAIQLEKPIILEEFSIWIRRLLVNRGICTFLLEDYYQQLWKVCNRFLNPYLPELEPMHQACERGLAYKQPINQYLFAQRDHLLDKIAAFAAPPPDITHDILRFETTCYLSYLMDAVEFDKQEVFIDHAVWMAKHADASQIPIDFHPVIFRAILKTVESEPAAAKHHVLLQEFLQR
jgi:hypothetical protein